MTRRWAAGEVIEVDGVRFRILPGRKGPGDLRLEHSVGGRWRPTGMALGFFLADYWYENEDVLYPPPARGGRYYLDALERAAVSGWHSEQERLAVEKCLKREREDPPPIVIDVPPSPRLYTVAQACCDDPGWHCDRCSLHLDNPYKVCQCTPASVVA